MENCKDKKESWITKNYNQKIPFKETSHNCLTAQRHNVLLAKFIFQFWTEQLKFNCNRDSNTEY